jgi:hypothetical protein
VAPEKLLIVYQKILVVVIAVGAIKKFMVFGKKIADRLS